MSQHDHWEHVYSTGLTGKLGWYVPHLQSSLNLIEGLNLSVDAPIMDVGGGASTLVDDLLKASYRSITVLDISEKAVASVKTRLGNRAKLVTWLNGDITSIDLPSQYFDLWHDRALFHFLTEQNQQQKYRDNLLKALKPGGYLIVATFAPEAPLKCSGLPVQRYSLGLLKRTLGSEFELEHHHKELHITPGGVEQAYLYCLFHRAA